MLDENRGKIRNLNRYKQLISYEGMMRRRRITPTDIDGLIDYNGICFVYLEAKHISAPAMVFGQRKAIENIVNSHEKAGHPCCAIIFKHNCDCEIVIVAKDQLITEVYYDHEWTTVTDQITVLTFIERWESAWDKNKLPI